MIVVRKTETEYSVHVTERENEELLEMSRDHNQDRDFFLTLAVNAGFQSTTKTLYGVDADVPDEVRAGAVTLCERASQEVE